MINEILGLQIITTPGMSLEECSYLIKQLECANLAKIQFAQGKLSLEDFCDILELCGVNVDEYLLQVEANLTTAGIL
ncbi:hypothetical protein VF14_26875 [Nostoc linckia z18]|jgi:hypothetical protein|uniref:Uncharacterized protein n=2 Tax=Nostoc linckia TaxID=92942 RepID=A0A9Q5Z924_NOSLI|nr:hypothetical protein [Nostoc linckia]PHK38794.1 hypothetical protein VF12_16860 [Nostoc linckia z15]PHK44312.1 hypothetical protein VF13_22540 [Nostoc linckia z16]PHJ62792.1 hypothetical protein VF02_16720 [Nostoc linckia z1]PHJ66622.1 hypothetical protein VF05_18995 [Nostoc linckia z3]PHJ72743.1 hypothetical protein VF03_18095 [Nostoc linckia z2]